MTNHPPTPMLDRQREARERGSQEIGQFLDWLRAEGVHFMKFAEYVEDEPCESLLTWRTGCDRKGYVRRYYEDIPGIPVEFADHGSIYMTCVLCNGSGWRGVTREGWIDDGRRIEELLAAYFEVDLAESERERNALLAWVRAQQG